MKISIVGTGYVGLVTGAGLADKGNDVICVDIVEEKVDKINRGKPPIYEEGLEGLLKKVVDEGTLKATTDTRQAVLESDITFICVGTPSKEDGSIDTSKVEKAAGDIADGLVEKKGYHVVCVKSTVVPGTTDDSILPILERSGKVVGEDVGLAMNPEFLREGKALDDFLDPDRIVIGGWDEESREMIERVYKRFDCPILTTNLRTAEMIKYASNALLATKISFANEISRICESIGIDVYDVMEGVGMDHRIDRDFLNAGCGFGGSCFPKDVRALIDFAEDLGEDPQIMRAALTVNETQPIHTVELLEDELGSLSEKKIALLGLTFKGDTDDVRESRAVPMAREMIERGALVIGYDPRGMSNFSPLVKGMEYADSIEEALTDAHGCIIQNDWEEFKKLGPSDFDVMKDPVVIDGRRVLDRDGAMEGVKYIGVGSGKKDY